MYAFRIVNVFTVDGDPLSGNPLCVFEDARGLSTEQMQALARQMNLSETTFVVPPTVLGADAHVRVFTPSYEMPFAGHPTLGTTSVIARDRDRVVLQMAAGLVHVRRDLTGWMLRTAQAPVTRAPAATRAQLAAMLSLPVDAICDEPLWVNTGVEQLIIPIATAAHVHAAKPVLELVETYGRLPDGDEAMAYLWTRDGWLVRFFFSSDGALLEDPATGSACANLGGYFVARGLAPISVTLAQGAHIARPSRLHLRADSDGIFVSGAVHELGRGTIDLVGDHPTQSPK